MMDSQQEHALPAHWTEAVPGGMAINPDPVDGGIIDTEIVSQQWFIIFHDERLSPIEGLGSREEAFAALQAALQSRAA